MSEPSPADFVAALRALGEGLDALGLPWMVIGGVAVITSGVPRYTADIDALEDRERPAVLERLLREAGLAPGDSPTGRAR